MGDHVKSIIVKTRKRPNGDGQEPDNLRGRMFRDEQPGCQQARGQKEATLRVDRPGIPEVGRHRIEIAWGFPWAVNRAAHVMTGWTRWRTGNAEGS